MLKKEFDEKYKMESVIEERSKFMFVDIFVLDGLLMALVFIILILRDLPLVIPAGIVVVVFAASYWVWKERKKNLVLDNNFIDLLVYCKDGGLNYQYPVIKHEILKEDDWILINDDYILDTTALFAGGYDISKDILCYEPDSSMLTKYGLGKAPGVNIVVTYHGEYKLGKKIIPVLMIRGTDPVLMGLSK